MIKKYSELPVVDKSEIARYLGYKNSMPDEATARLIDEKINELKCDFKVCYMPLKAITNDGEEADFGFFSVKSRDFCKFIGDNKEIMLFGATIGIEFDRLMKKETVLSPSGAAVLQAVGTTYIEALCDMFCMEFGTKKRFSPGYGDLDITAQKDIFRVLEMGKNIGVSLTDSMLMTPTKSVTAFFVPNSKECGGCEDCDKKENCSFRKVL